LTAPPNLNRDLVLRRLATKQLGRSLQVLDECTSTNDLAAQMADAGAPHGYTVLAEVQTSGRGRHGRPWLSPRGGIWLSSVFHSPPAIDSVTVLPTVAALATAKTVASISGITARVRWPNDVVVGDRKLAGVIAEAKFEGNQLKYAVVGVGINANFHSHVLGVVGSTSISLEDLLGFGVDREQVVGLLLAELENVYDWASSDLNGAMRLLKDFDCSRERHVMIELQDEVVYGTVTGYESFANVQIKTASGSCRLIETGTVRRVEYLTPRA
jgi:BirA family biotin operon repressor/biotin-[acetyl-CoA-carboxylase] ligase